MKFSFMPVPRDSTNGRQHRGLIAQAIAQLQSNVVPSSGGEFTGSVAVDGVVDLSNAAAGQIKFPATQHASSDANTLDDYEEGAMTPILAINGSTTGITYATQAGFYTKVGNRVYFNCRFTLSSKGALVGNLQLRGLPFVLASGVQHSAVSLWFTGITSGVVPVCAASPGFSVANLQKIVAGAIAPMTDTDIGNTSDFIVSGHYQAA